MRARTQTRWMAYLLLWSFTTSGLLSAAEKAGTEKVAPGKFLVQLKLSGVFESPEMTEVQLRPDEWSSFKVERVVKPGTPVRQGDVLIQFEVKEIEEAIRETTFAVETGRLSLEEAMVELETMKQVAPLDLKDARQSHEMAVMELDYYNRFFEKLNRMRTDMSLKSSLQNLESAQEEFDQLEKMYKADDLTEETEEIVLKRAKQSIESAQLWHEFSKVNYQQEIQFELPKQKERVEEAVVRAQSALQRTQVTVPASLRKKEIELEKAKLSLAKETEKLERLKLDRKLMTIVSPVDGVVYYGAAERGRWSEATKMLEALKPGQSVPTEKVLITIVNDSNLFVRAEVPEKELYRVTPGLSGRTTPTAYPNDRIASKVESVEPVALGEVNYDARISLDVVAGAKKVQPGMNCEVRLTVYQQDAVLSLPNDAVFADDDDDTQRYVLIDEGGTGVRRNVTVGQMNDTRTEITAGLAAGDVVHLKKP
ncbi:MAG: HlyD family efflux transporter periplasmic adaptor subunit [Planctomycetaceae bacterium]